MEKKILIAHSDQDVSFLMKKMLQLPNVQVIIKKTYEEIANAISNSFYDLIVTDDIINGNFLFQYIEDLKLNSPDTRIIVMSKMDEHSLKASVEEMGEKDFISLPVGLPEVKELVSSYI